MRAAENFLRSLEIQIFVESMYGTNRSRGTLIPQGEIDTKFAGQVGVGRGEKQKHFLLSVNSQTCAYCMPAGPEGVVEVKSKAAIKYSFEPIIVSGKMSVLKNDPTGLYYRLNEAAPATLTPFPHSAKRLQIEGRSGITPQPTRRRCRRRAKITTARISPP